MKTVQTQIKEHASKTFGFAYSKVVPLECSTRNGLVTNYLFSVCGREYSASATEDYLICKIVDQRDGETILRDMPMASAERIERDRRG